jgi:hypothetical protein
VCWNRKIIIPLSTLFSKYRKKVISILIKFWSAGSIRVDTRNCAPFWHTLNYNNLLLIFNLLVFIAQNCHIIRSGAGGAGKDLRRTPDRFSLIFMN